MHNHTLYALLALALISIPVLVPLTYFSLTNHDFQSRSIQPFCLSLKQSQIPTSTNKQQSQPVDYYLCVSCVQRDQFMPAGVEVSEIGRYDIGEHGKVVLGWDRLGEDKATLMDKCQAIAYATNYAALRQDNTGKKLTTQRVYLDPESIARELRLPLHPYTLHQVTRARTLALSSSRLTAVLQVVRSRAPPSPLLSLSYSPVTLLASFSQLIAIYTVISLCVCVGVVVYRVHTGEGLHLDIGVSMCGLVCALASLVVYGFQHSDMAWFTAQMIFMVMCLGKLSLPLPRILLFQATITLLHLLPLHPSILTAALYIPITLALLHTHTRPQLQPYWVYLVVVWGSMGVLGVGDWLGGGLRYGVARDTVMVLAMGGLEMLRGVELVGFWPRGARQGEHEEQTQTIAGK